MFWWKNSCYSNLFEWYKISRYSSYLGGNADACAHDPCFEQTLTRAPPALLDLRPLLLDSEKNTVSDLPWEKGATIQEELRRSWATGHTAQVFADGRREIV